MSRRIQCNTLSVTKRPDGTCGIIECDTIKYNKIICNTETGSKGEGDAKKYIQIPYSLPITCISFGMMGKCESDATKQIIYIPCAFDSNHLILSWHDWSEGITSENIVYKINDQGWKDVTIDKSQIIIEHKEKFVKDTYVTTQMYSKLDDENDEPIIQSLTVSLCGSHSIQLS